MTIVSRILLSTSVWLAAGVAPEGAGASFAQPCFDLRLGEPTSLTGILDHVVFPGPPGYDSVEQGDTPEPSYVLRLDEPICLTGDEFADSDQAVSSVQLVTDGKLSRQLQTSLHRRVTLGLERPTAAHTGHHHEPLVACVTFMHAQPQ